MRMMARPRMLCRPLLWHQDIATRAIMVQSTGTSFQRTKTCRACFSSSSKPPHHSWRSTWESSWLRKSTERIKDRSIESLRSSWQAAKTKSQERLQGAQRSATGYVRQIPQRLATSAQSTLASLWQRSIEQIRNSIATATRPISDYVRGALPQSVRWIGWWSLAAIAVYGIATTVPKEVVRHYLNRPNRNGDNINDDGRNAS